MPDFTIRGDPGQVRARCVVMREKARLFSQTGDELERITTDGWTGRAAEKFRDKFDTEPERWRDAGSGFDRAASGLEAYAAALEDAQRRARAAEREHARGDEVTRDARAAYDADVSRAQREATSLRAQGTVVDLTIVPFHDPGEAIRQQALADVAAARSDVEEAAHRSAGDVRAGCAAAPEEKNWLEKGLSSVGGFFAGAGEAVWGLVTLPMSPISLLQDGFALASGDLTPEEMAAKYRLGVEQVGAMADALREDPLEFGKQLGKGLLDWDTWSDDPARALGHLLPDAVAAVFTAGTGAVATRGVKGSVDAVDALGDIARLSRADDLAGITRVDDVADGTRGLEGLDDVADASRADDVPLRDEDGLLPDHDALTNKQQAEAYGIDNPTQDMRVYRAFGEAQDDLGGLQRGSMPFGESWTPKDPRLSDDFRRDAGLPDENPGRFVVEGILRRPSHVDEVRPALPLDGNPGGWPEYLIKDAADAVEVRDVSGLNEPWTRQPGDWAPPPSS